jgi:hypothetical protein
VASPARADAPPARRQRDRLPLAAGLDTAVVVAFAALGRRNHDEEPGLAGVFETAAPFLIGLLVAWIVVRAWRAPERIGTGLAVWPITVAVGMVVRRFVFDEGTALPFVIVATIFLGACFIGWRAALRLLTRRL